MDDVKARSEARRRKILENAEARLKKISDARFSRPVPSIVENYDNENIPEAGVCEAMPFVNGSPPRRSPESSDRQSVNGNVEEATVSNHSQPADDFLTRLTAALNASEGTTSPNNSLGEPTNWSDFMLIISLGILVRLMYNTKYAWIFTESMWVPFLSVAIPDLLLSLSRGPPPAGFLYSFVVLCGVPPHRVAYFFYAITFLRRLLQFFSLYIFSFIVTHIVAGELLVHLT